MADDKKEHEDLTAHYKQESAKGKPDEKQIKALSEVCQTHNYKEQAIFFLNAFWTEFGEDADKIFKMHLMMNNIAEEQKKPEENLNDLDDFASARFLEMQKLTLTVLQRRAALREIDLDSNNRMSLLEFLVWHYKVKVDVMMKKPQGTNKALKNAEKALKEVMNEIAKIESRKAYLKGLMSKGGVKAMTAKNEMEQLLSKDPIPLNRALISAQAKIRICQKKGDLTAQGDVWWLQHELDEAKNYKPKGGIDKSRFSVSE